MPIIVALLVMLAMAGIPGCYIVSASNSLEKRDEYVKQFWANLLTAYKNRADTLPALYDITKGVAAHEMTVIHKHAEARAAAQKVRIPEDAKPEDLYKFLQIQKDIGAGIGRLLAVAESTPTIQATKNFLDLNQKITDLNTQIMANQRKFVREVTAYNINIRTFPSSLVASWKGAKPKKQLTFDDELDIKPTILRLSSRPE